MKANELKKGQRLFWHMGDRMHLIQVTKILLNKPNPKEPRDTVHFTVLHPDVEDAEKVSVSLPGKDIPGFYPATDEVYKGMIAFLIKERDQIQRDINVCLSRIEKFVNTGRG